MSTYYKYVCAIAIMVLLLPIVGQAEDKKSMADMTSVVDPYVRAVPKLHEKSNSAAFMQLKNKGSEKLSIVNAASPVANIVELHTHINDNGMMKMRRIKQIDVASNGETILKPGGLHVMLMELKQTIADGQEVPVTLMFEDGSNKDLLIPARKMQMFMKKKGHKKTN